MSGVNFEPALSVLFLSTSLDKVFESYFFCCVCGHMVDFLACRFFLLLHLLWSIYLCLLALIWM